MRADVIELAGRSARPDTPNRRTPVVLLPGMVAGDWMWGVTPQVLTEAGFDVLLFRDAIGVLAASVEEMTDAVEAALEARDAQRVHLAGASLGAAVALRFAARHPERIETLILSGAPTMVGNAELGIASFGKLTRGVADAARDRLFYDRRRLPDALLELSFQTFLNRRRFLNVVRLMRESERFDSATPLKSLAAETLMVWGEQDRVSKCEDWRRFVPLARHGTFVTIPECGHSPMLEQPEAFNEALLKFLPKPRMPLS